MPTVPNSDALPYSPVGSLPSVQANPTDFGGQVGQAVQGVGQDLNRASTDLGDTATMLKQRQRTIAVNNELNGAISDFHNVGSGDPNNPNDPGYFGKQGMDAVNGRKSAFDALTASYQGHLNNLQNDPLGQAMFEQDARRYMNMTQSSFDEHYEQQSKVALVGSAKATSDLLQQGLYNARNNDQLWQQTFQQGLAAKRNEIAAQGGTTAQVTAAQQDFTEQAGYQRIQGWIGDGTPQSVQLAQQYLHDHSTDFKPANYDSLNNQLQPKVRSFEATQATNSAISTARQGWEAQQASGPPMSAGQYASQVAQDESGGNPNAKSATSSAAGPAGFTDGTWNSFLQAAHPDMLTGKSPQQVAGLKSNTGLSQEATIWLARQNAAQLGQAQQPVDATTLRLAHVVGGQGAVKVLGAAPDTPLANVLDPAAITANPQFANLTTSQLVGQYRDRYGSAPVDLSSGVGSPAGAGFGTKPVQSEADYYKANEASIVETARQGALKTHPDDLGYANLVAAQTEQHVRQVIGQQDVAYGADRDLVEQAANGNLVKGTHPASVAELIQTSPQVSQAWDRLTVQQPDVAHQISTRLLSENARTGGKDSETYGPAFGNVFTRIHAAEGDPNKITDPSQLYGLVGKPDGITMAGLSRAREEMAGKATPEGEAESALRTQLFKVAKGQISGADDGLGMKDPQGDSIYLRWMASIYPAIQAAKAKGLTPGQIYSPDSPDYVGKNIPAFKRSLTQRTADMLDANTGVSGTATPAAPSSGLFGGLFGGGGPDLSGPPESIKSLYAAGKIDRATAIKALVGKEHPAPATTPAATE